MGDEPIEGIVGCELRLDGHELPVDVPLEADEEQPGIPLSGLWIRSIVEGIASPEDAPPGLPGQPDVGVRRDQELAVWSHCIQIHRIELVVFSQRCSALLVSPDDALLVLD
jgi:hypothetical protein